MEYREVGGMHACTHPTHGTYTASGVGVLFQPLLSVTRTHADEGEGVIIKVTQIILSGIRLFGLCLCDSWHHLHALHGKLASSVASIAIIEQSPRASC